MKIGAALFLKFFPGNIGRIACLLYTSLQAVFSMLGDGETEKRVLSRFGYLLGRLVYLLDALDDLEDDLKAGSYNPFLLKFSVDNLSEEEIKEILDYGKGTLNITVAEMGTTYELLELYRYKTCLLYTSRCV